MLKKVKTILILLPFLLKNLSAQEVIRKADIHVDLSVEKGPMKPFWAWFGYDEPNYTYMKDGKKLLTEISALSPAPVYVRTHSLMVTGDGEAALKWGSTNMYTEDSNGNAIYNWKIIDSIFDTYIKRGMKPFAQIGFMPQALSTHPEPYRHHWKPGDSYKDIATGWTYPPKDYKKWGDLVYNWVKHSINRYGKKEVESWYWEVWNEPNGFYWKGTEQELFKLYDYAADGVKRALPSAKIGGFNVAGTSGRGAQQMLNDFIKHCTTETNYATGHTGSPLDILTFHAKGQPSIVNGMVRMNASPHLRDIEAGFKVATAYPETKNIPLIVGESDPEGCAACGMATDPQNAYRNGTLYPSYTAATIAREYELADQYKVNLRGAVNWSFEFENQPWFYGFRDLATNGVDKPILNLFRMLGKMTGSRVKAQSNRMYPLKTMLDSSIRGPLSDIGVLASKDKTTAGILIWNYHDNDEKKPAEQVSLQVENIPVKSVRLAHYRIDDQHSNSYEAWKKMGSPQSPSAGQIAELEKAGQLQTIGTAQNINVKSGKININFDLPRQGISFIKIDW